MALAAVKTATDTQLALRRRASTKLGSHSDKRRASDLDPGGFNGWTPGGPLREPLAIRIPVRDVPSLSLVRSREIIIQIHKSDTTYAGSGN